MAEALNIVSLLVATSAVLGTAVVGTQLCRLETARSRWLAVATLFVALIIFYTLGMGLLGVLTAPVLLAVALLGFVGVAGVYEYRGRSLRTVGNSYYTELVRIVTVIRGSTLLSILTGAFVVIFSWVVFVAVLVPPAAWDSTAYHLYPVVNWIQQESIGMEAYGRTNSIKNIEVLVTWNTVFLRDQVLMNIVQLAFVPIGFLATYVIGREIGLSVENGLLSGFAFALTPIVLIQAATAYVDLAVGALVLVSVAFLLRFWSEPQMNHLYLFGISTGLLLGAKKSGLVYTAVLGLGLTATLLSKYERDYRKIGSHLSAVSLLIVLLGGFWYVRNWIKFGNPIFPYPVSIFGIELFPGIVSPLQPGYGYGGFAERLHGPQVSFFDLLYVSWFEKIPIYGYSPGIGSIGAHWAVLGLPGIVLFSYDAVRRRNPKHLLLLAVIVLPLFVISPWKIRFVIYLAGFGAIAIGYAAQSVVTEAKIPLAVLLCLLLLLSGGLSTGLQPWHHDRYITQSLSDYDDRTTMQVNQGVTISIPQEDFQSHVPSGSRIGFTPNQSTSDHMFNLYDRQLRNRLTRLKSISERDNFRTRIETEEIEYLILPKQSRQANWSRQFGHTVLYEGEYYYIFEVDE